MEIQELLMISGTVSSLVYQNEESGYTVLRLFRDDTGEEITAVGCLPYVSKGESLHLTGAWTTHASYGEQFSVSAFERDLPKDEEEMLSYLAGGAVKGIGPKTAERIVRRFGTESLYVISTDAGKLSEVKGITMDKADQISREFNRRASLRVLTDFIVQSGLPLSLAFRLYRAYGEFALKELKKNPYLICKSAFGEDFGVADRIAGSFGIEGDDPVRVDAGILFELIFNLQNGHAFIPYEKLTHAVCGLLTIGLDAAERGISRLRDTGEITVQEICLEQAVYLSDIYAMECAVANKLTMLSEFCGVDPRYAKEAVSKVEKKTGIRYAEAQKGALYTCARFGVMVLTGGPGTGKTTAVRGMLELFDLMRLETSLCAPTGRAAKRLSELCGKEASTIHRLLEATFSYDDNQMKFQRNEKNPLKTDVIIVDESSMLDVILANALLGAAKPGTKFIFVGDADQLPPVGPGNFLRDLIASGLVPTVKLCEIFRQSKESDIVLNAHRINHGEIPDLNKNAGDFFFVGRKNSATLTETVCELCASRIPGTFGFSGDDIQILSPSKIGASGTVVLNAALQEALNPPDGEKKEVNLGTYVLREGDRVLQTRNNYELIWRRVPSMEVGAGIFNGEIGKIITIDPKLQAATILFDDKTVDYPFSELYEIELAYAMTTHKAQGSEFEAVVLCLSRIPKRLMTRSILYTAVTRAKRLLVVVGDRESVEAMVSSDVKAKRYSALRVRLAGKTCSAEQ